MEDDAKLTLILVRHATSTYNEQGRMQGQLDPPLSETGEREAAAVAQRLRDQDFSLIYSSDLQRALDTARAISRATGRLIQPDPRLRERHLGIFQGKTWEEVQKAHPDVVANLQAGKSEYAVPGGESWKRIFQRVRSFLDEVLQQHRGETVVVVSHGGILNAIFRIVNGMPEGRMAPLWMPNGCISRIEYKYEEGSWILATWADVCHLDGLP